MRHLRKLLAIAIIALISTSCCNKETSSSAAANNTFPDAQAKYIFYFIGDGMAATQVQLAAAALTTPKFQDNYARLTGSTEPIEELNIKSLNITGLATSNASNRYITDSAAAGTALATGSKTDVGVIGLDADGNILRSVAEIAKEKGMKVGIVSSVSIDHATPASFYAHTKSRNEYAKISDQLLESGFDYFAGGSVKWSSRAKSENSDTATAYANYCKRATEKGYVFATNKAAFDNLKATDNQKVITSLKSLTEDLNTNDGSAMPFTIDLGKQCCDDNKISLAQFTQKGIDLLKNDKGFFMMVEGGKIDWACHSNDAAAAAYEVVAFDEAIGVAMEFAAQHPKETLIVVTGDHDCGGLTLGFAGTGYESAFDVLANSKVSIGIFTQNAVKMISDGESFDDLLGYACDEFGFTNEVDNQTENAISRSPELTNYEVKALHDAYLKSIKRLNKGNIDAADKFNGSFGGSDPFSATCIRLLNNKSGVDFASYSHTAVPVMVYASGASADIFSGYYDNTDIPKKIMQAARLN